MSDRVRRTAELLRDTWGVLLVAAALGCGGAENPGSADGAPDGAADRETPVTEAAREARDGTGGGDAPVGARILAPGEVGFLTGSLTGAKDTTYEGSTAGGNVEFFGFCDDDVPLRLGFNVADGDGVQVARFQGRTDAILEPGETGSFPVETASAWYQRMGLPSRTTFEGSGTLEITQHDARRRARLMRGRLSGRGLEDSGGERVDMEVDFEVGLSCGVEG